MRDLRAMATAMAIMALAMTGEAFGQAPWQTVTSADGSFTVEMPGDPHYFREERKTANGTPFTLHQYLVEQGEGQVIYIAQSGEYPNDFDVSDPRSLLEQVLGNGAKGLDGGQWNSATWGAQQGATTVESLGVKGETDQRNLSAMRGRAFYDLIYIGPRGSATFPDANRFFSSLKLGVNVAPQRPLSPMGSMPLQRDRR